MRRMESMRPTTRLVSQVALHLHGEESKETFAAARDLVLRWVAPRAGSPLPPKAWEGESFELDAIGSQRAAAVRLDEPRMYWSARLDDADKGVAQRTWVTEIGIGVEGQDVVILGVRLVCVTRGEDSPYDPSIPGVVAQAIDRLDAHLDDRKLTPGDWLVSNPGDVDKLVALLMNSSRRCDVIVCALPEYSVEPREALINIDRVRRRTAGVAHVAIITGPASFLLTDRVGREFSVFRGAVRTYRPGFDLTLDEPFRHPLGVPERIQSWSGGPTGFEDFLVAQAIHRSATSRDRETLLISFAEARELAIRHRRQTEGEGSQTDAEMLQAAWDEIARLNQDHVQELDEYKQLLAEAEQEREAALEDAQQARAQVQAISWRAETLEKRIEEQTGAPVLVPIPSDLDGIEEWCWEHLAGRVDVHSRAFRGAKNCEYEDTSLVFRFLLLLRDYYVPMRQSGGAELRVAYEARCAELGLKDEETFTGPGWGEEGETYVVRYRGQRRKLDRHLTKGTSREPRYCFRLYFFWDDETAQVVVGWLPSHLDSRAS